ncbi:hypothetical protein COY65_00250 [Candidatus Jorgensenbacteria bacterium CG_4_10_14_0_8_um_filter_39_13]|uniref:GH18 domain-containing protein n=2 Tax=Candidatus Joergenseniibacteriota TaxID=1752739 RepID=A0A2M7RIK3_9BACT|nr:MAG: hypothetical protein COV54_03585 [Candidatus Jorgensenbacteria bacterium CG11_big_fil_rev_8_21_14_0_20_38_23]PIY96593.1 MAG: hypothetical protein COY65_00250 [Candidatus Jorgensenbacteria bacterium CG_4_10_14_0_8_um_filter_39_13]PJA95000.1 MAG: hypothetical protein CO130_01485 [Candidatus Jorgensenbacteria bacterium CG_4_9_14_3_um_filter_38_10]
MKKIPKFISGFILIGLVLNIFLPVQSLAAAKKVKRAKTPFYYAGWFPFWKKQSGSQDISLNLEKFHEISPFSYEVKPDGTLVDILKITEGFWPVWLSAVRDMKIKIIPTIAWFDGPAIHALLSDKEKRLDHEDTIAKLVKDNKFDGIDIDYEAKLAETNSYFSLFIKGLAIRLHPLGKTLSCTIEPRTSLSSKYIKLPDSSEIAYANDYKVLNKYCDEVRILAYDQGLIDIKLNSQKGNGELYAPVADPDWVKKILKETLKSISPKKIMLGVPTYGYEYEVAWASSLTTYKRLRSHTFFQAMNRADSVGVAPSRNSAGELSFIYATSTAVDNISPNLTWTASSTLPSTLASTILNNGVTRFVSFSDAESAKQKIALAKKFGLHGVVFFKWDGDQDPLLWEAMK